MADISQMTLPDGSVVNLKDSAGREASSTGLLGKVSIAQGIQNKGKILQVSNGGNLELVDPGSGSGDVTGPSSASNNNVVVFDGTTGKLVKDSGFTIGKSVPSDAVFTDTTYESKSAASGGTDESLVTTGEKYIWNSKTSNVGTVTGVKMNNGSAIDPDANGIVDLGTVITSHQDISGKADLVDGKVPSTQLPSYVDDVLEYSNQSLFPLTGETGKIYIAQDTNKTYRWSGSTYVAIASDLAIGETSTTAYRGDRGKAAYDHAMAKGSEYSLGFYKIETNSEGHVINKSNVLLSDLNNLGVAAKVTDAIAGNFAALDAEGNLVDSGHKPSDYLTQHQDINGKADKDTNAIEGNFASFDANGNPVDSGHKHSDYLTQHQDISGKADKIDSLYFAVCNDTYSMEQIKQITISNFPSTLTDGIKIRVLFKGAQLYTGYEIKLKVNNLDAKSIIRQVDSDSMHEMAGYNEWNAWEFIDFVYYTSRSTGYWYITGRRDASTTYRGLTKLSNSITSTLTSIAASSYAVKTLNDNKINVSEKGAANGVAELDQNGKIPSSQVPSDETKIDVTEKGEANGVAELDNNGKVPSSQLPSYVDDVLEYSSLSEFPATGESGKIYVDTTTNITYRWSGSAYIAIGSDLALGETSSTAYRGDRGAAAYAAAVTNVDSTPTTNSTHLITSGGVKAALPTSSDIVNIVYPVGSIYMSVSSTSPATLFGGTWAALEGRFLIGANSTYTAGSTGGAASVSYTPAGSNSGGSVSSHTLTSDQIPSHNHSFTGSAVTSGGISVGHTHTTTTGNPSANHTHSGPSHTHTGPSHTHTGPKHQHSWGKYKLGTAHEGTGTAFKVDMDLAGAGSYLTGEAGNGATGSAGTGATGSAGTGSTGTVSAWHTHTGTSGQPSAGHTHSVTASGSVGSTGGGKGHNHGFTNPTFTGTAATIATMPPYLSVYMWKRTA